MSFLQRAKNKLDSIVNKKGKGSAHSSGTHSVLQSEFSAELPSSTGSERAGSHQGSMGHGHGGGHHHEGSHRGTSPTNTLSDETGSQGHHTPSRAGPTVQENLIVDELTADNIDLDKLKKLCWSGCPDGFRAECWGVLTGYYPLTHSNREVFMKRKRAEYQSYVVSSYSNVDWPKMLELGNNGNIGTPGQGGADGEGPAGSTIVGVEELSIMKQIRKDLPRAGNVKVLHCVRIQAIMERILYIWAVRHPACGYVQGMNDLVYPFLYVLLVDHVAAANSRVSFFVSHKTVDEAEDALKAIGHHGFVSPPPSTASQDTASHTTPSRRQQQESLLAGAATAGGGNSANRRQRLGGSPTAPVSPVVETTGPLTTGISTGNAEADWANFEADLYWNVSRVMEKVQANYTFNQAGCHAMVKKLEELIKVVDPALYKHLVDKLQIQFFNFGFRWMNCLLLRELNPMQALRLWDTYLCEEDYSSFHVYVCCELLVRWSPQIRKISDGGDGLSFLQSPPTHLFHDRDLDEIVSAAFVLQQTYDKSFKHLLECQDQQSQGSAHKRAPSSNNSSMGGMSRSSD